MPISSTEACSFGLPQRTTGPIRGISKDPRVHKDRKVCKDLRAQPVLRARREPRGRKVQQGHREHPVLRVLQAPMAARSSMAPRTPPPEPVPTVISTSTTQRTPSSGRRPVVHGVLAFLLLDRKAPPEQLAHKERQVLLDRKATQEPLVRRVQQGLKEQLARQEPMAPTGRMEQMALTERPFSTELPIQRTR